MVARPREERPEAVGKRQRQARRAALYLRGYFIMATNSYIQKVGGYIKYGRKIIPNNGNGGAAAGSYEIMTGKITLKKAVPERWPFLI